MHITDTAITLASEGRFALMFISGDPGSGKTHLATYCAGMLQALSYPVRVLRGSEVSSWSKRDLPKQRIKSGETLIVDDAEEWLEDRGNDGVFTALADRVLQAKGLLIMMSTRSVAKLKVSAQIKSRLTAGVQLSVGLPEERHLDAILRAMTKQRGLKLTPAKRAFILKRVPRTVVGLTEYFSRLQRAAERHTASTSFEALAEAAGEWG